MSKRPYEGGPSKRKKTIAKADALRAVTENTKPITLSFWRARRANTKGGYGSGVPESTPESKIFEKPHPDPEPLFIFRRSSLCGFRIRYFLSKNIAEFQPHRWQPESEQESDSEIWKFFGPGSGFKNFKTGADSESEDVTTAISAFQKGPIFKNALGPENEISHLTHSTREITLSCRFAWFTLHISILTPAFPLWKSAEAAASGGLKIVHGFQHLLSVFFSLRHFGHLSHRFMKTSHNSVH